MKTEPKELKIIKKAYQLNTWKLNLSDEERHYANQDLVIARAETIGKAKSKILELIRFFEYKNWDDEIVNYRTLYIKRAPEYDYVLFEGVEVVRHKIPTLERLNEERKEQLEILANKSISYCFIQKGGYYYCSGYCGYTSHENQAGLYLKETAIRYVGRDANLKVVPVDTRVFNNTIKTEIKRLQSKIIYCQF